MTCREWCLFCNGRDNFTVYDKKSTVGCNFSFLRELFVMIKLCYSKGEMMDYIVAKKDSMLVKIPIGEILYIGTMSDCPRLLQFITDNGIFEAYGKIKDFEIDMGLVFRRCHRKYLVNLKRIKAIDLGTRRIMFDNSKVNSIVCSRRKLTEVLKDWKNL